MSSDIESRLRILEEGYEYQDRTVEALNQVVIQQQNQIDKLVEELAKVREDLTTATLDGDPTLPPPHY